MDWVAAVSAELDANPERHPSAGRPPSGAIVKIICL